MYNEKKEGQMLNKELKERCEFRNILPHEADQAAEIREDLFSAQ